MRQNYLLKTNRLLLIVHSITFFFGTVGLITQLSRAADMPKAFSNLIMLIIPALATPMTVFFIRMYLKATFSKEIVESARLDGAGEFRIFNQIMLPLMKPAIATQTIFCFVASWTDEWVPRIILIDTSKEIQTLPLISSYQGGALLMLIPPVVLYALLSKHIVEGIALGSVKA